MTSARKNGPKLTFPIRIAETTIQRLLPTNARIAATFWLGINPWGDSEKRTHQTSETKQKPRGEDGERDTGLGRFGMFATS